jgi:hypothetical protein
MQIMDLGEKLASSQDDLLSTTGAALSAEINSLIYEPDICA